MGTEGRGAWRAVAPKYFAFGKKIVSNIYIENLIFKTIV